MFLQILKNEYAEYKAHKQLAMGNGKAQHEHRAADSIATQRCYRSKPHAEVWSHM